MIIKHIMSILFLSSFLFSQNSILDSSTTGKKKQKKIIEAIVGDDIEAPGLTSIILDASKSTPNNGSLTYEWSFPENLIFAEDYEYDASETIISYSNDELLEEPLQNKTSIKKLTSRNKYVELDLPDFNMGKTFSVLLKIQNHVGMKDLDTLTIVVTPSINFNIEGLNIGEGDQYLSIQDSSEENGEELTETIINESFLTIQPINKKSLKPMEVELINSLIYKKIREKGFNDVLNPNRFIAEEININKLYQKNKVIQDTVITEIRSELSSQVSFLQKFRNFFKPDTSLKDSFAIPNEPIVSDESSVSTDLSSLNIEDDKNNIANAAPKNIFKRLFNKFSKAKALRDSSDIKSLDLMLANSKDSLAVLNEPIVSDGLVVATNSSSIGIEDDKINIVDAVPKNIFKRLFNKLSKAKVLRDSSDIKSLDLVSTESLIIQDSLKISNPISENSIDLKPVDSSSITNNTIIVAYDTTIINDTLTYTEVIDTTLYYNFSCETDSCAAENALLEGAGRVLTWGINSESDLELRYFTVADFFNQDTQFDWTIKKVKLNPDAEKFITYPKTIATSADGSLYIGEGNTQNIIEIKKDQTAEIVVSDVILNKDLLSPSGLAIGSNKEIYFSDKYNNRVIINSGDSYRDLLNSNSNYNNDGTLPPIYPSTVRIGPNGAVFTLYDKDGSLYKVSKREINTILNPNILNGIDDFAINSIGEIFVLSSENKKIYKVITEDEVLLIAGIDRISNKKVIYRKNKDSKSLQFSGRPQDPALVNDFPATKIPFGQPVSIDFDSDDNLFVADIEYGTIRKIDKEGIITTFFGPSNQLKEVHQIRLSQVGSFEIFATKPFSHEIQRIHLSEVSPWVDKSIINYPKYIIAKDGVFGLEDKLNESLSSTLAQTLPPVKIPIRERFSQRNKKVAQFVSKNPLFCGLLLLLVNQGVAASLEDPPKLPPDFPFLD